MADNNPYSPPGIAATHHTPAERTPKYAARLRTVGLYVGIAFGVPVGIAVFAGSGELGAAVWMFAWSGAALGMVLALLGSIAGRAIDGL